MSVSGSSPTRPAASCGGGELVSSGGYSARSLSSSCGVSRLLMPAPFMSSPPCVAVSARCDRSPSRRILPPAGNLVVIVEPGRGAVIRGAGGGHRRVELRELIRIEPFELALVEPREPLDAFLGDV